VVEVGAVIDLDGHPIFWQNPRDSSGAIRDSSELWAVLWKNRFRISGHAHSHPGEFTKPSYTDVTTFAAIEAGLGKRLDWWIATSRDLSRNYWVGPDRLDYVHLVVVSFEPVWLPKLRRLSYKEGDNNA